MYDLFRCYVEIWRTGWIGFDDDRAGHGLFGMECIEEMMRGDGGLWRSSKI